MLSTTLKLWFFGAFAVEVDGENVKPPRWRKSQWLLALLALRQGRDVSRTWLAETLWPDAEPSAALFNLRQTLAQDLRKSLGGASQLIRASSSSTLCLDLTGAWCDVTAFDAAISKSPAEAVALHRGLFLEACMEEWAVQERAQREQAYLGALEILASSAVEREEPSAAVRYLRLTIAADPFREAAHSTLMQALADCGDYAAVTQVYRDLRLLLHRELNSSPSAEIDALYNRLKQRALVALPVARVASEPLMAAPSQLSSVSPGGALTFLFTDMVGSTRLWEDNPEAMSSALARHDVLLRETIESHRGHVFKTVGDAFCAVFGSATAALTAARDIHLRLLAEPWPDTGPIRVRIALHTGEAEERNGDYFGATVNRVARLQPLAYAQQTLLSQAAHDQVKSRVPAGATLQDMGSHRLKDLHEPEMVWQMLHTDLPQTFPPLKSLQYLPTNLPQQLTAFIGREAQVTRVQSLLSSHRLVTLTGFGGCGKTRLALQAAAGLLDEFSDGVWLVELASLSDPALVASTTANVLGLREEPGRQAVQTLADYLKSRKLLLLLDNCEHLLTACALLTDALLKNSANLHILASSREALGVMGEQTYRVPPLSIPDPEAETPENLLESESVRLFAERAGLVRPDFTATPANAAVLAQVCRYLDGIPLAIELAAARVRSMSLQQLNDRLSDSFRVLTGGSRTVTPRQQTMRATLDWSYNLLSEHEKLLLARLSVFAGGWSLEAAEAVCAPDEAVGSRQSAVERPEPSECLLPTADCLLPSDVLDLLTSLVDKSLVMFEDGAAGARYSLLETVRQYARERLTNSVGNEEARERHTDYYLELTDQARLKLDGPDQAAWYRRLEEEHDNLRVALDWSLTSRDEEREASAAPATGLPRAPRSGSSVDGHLRPTALLLCGALFRFWLVRGHLSEGRLWCARALERDEAGGPCNERAKVLIGAGLLSDAQGDYASARMYHNESLAIWQAIGDQHGIAASLNNLGMLEAGRRDYDAARDYFHRGLVLYLEIGHRSGAGYALNNLGRVAMGQGDFNFARDCCEQSLTIQREIGHQHGIALALMNLAEIAETQDDCACARDYCEESLVIQREIGNRAGIAFALMKLGNVANTLGDYAVAQRYSEESLTIFREIGDVSGIANSLFGAGIAAASQGDHAVARAFIRESCSLFTELGDRVGNAASLELFARLAATDNRSEFAAKLLGAAQALRDQIGLPRTPTELAEYDRAVADVRLRLGEAEWQECWTEGRSMTLERAISFANESPA